MARTSPGSFRLFSVFGIDVFLHWSWFIVAVIELQFWSGGTGAELALQVAIYLSLFAIVLVHEFGHALACRSVGGRADHIVLWPLGGIAYVEPPQRPGALLWSIAAGPLVNVVLLPITAAIFFALIPLPPQGTSLDAWIGGWSLVQQYVAAVTFINAMLLAFNLLPIYPLDGGQIVQAILWFFIGRVWSLRITAGFGLAVAVGVGIPLLLARQWWLAVLAAFVGWQAWRGLQAARYLAAIEASQAQHEEPWKM